MSLNNVPLTGQTLAVTRDQIAQNFSVIDTAFTVASAQPQHIPYNDGSGNQGMHNFIQMPVYSGSTNPPTVPSGQIGLYNKVGTFNGDIFIKKNTPNITGGGGNTQQEYPITFFTANTAVSPIGTKGWGYLPNGLLMLWGVDNVSSGPITYLNYTNAFPGFAQFATAPMLTRIDIGASSASNFLFISAYSNTGFTAAGSAGATNVPYAWFVMGK